MGFFGKKAAAVDDAMPARSAEPKPGGAQPSRKVWGVLLVLSIVMMFVFGGAIAGLVYMRVTTPPLAQVTTAPHKAHKSAVAAAEAAKADAPKPAAEAKKPEPKDQVKPEVKAPVAVKAVETKSSSDRPTGSPAVHAAALPKHTMEPMATPAKAEKPAASKPAPAAGRVRATVVEFTHSSPSAKEVLLRGPFLVRTGGKKLMLKDSSGVWRLSLSLLPGTYKYSFVVDGKRTPGESRVVQ